MQKEKRLIQQLIDETVESTYQKYGHLGKAQVIVQPQKKIVVSINTEVPYMGMTFWQFLGDVNKTLDELLKNAGYTKKKEEYFFDFYVVEYVFTGEENKDSTT